MGVIEDLERLQKLKEQGVLTQEEFENEKKKILRNQKQEKTNNSKETEIKKGKKENNKKSAKVFIIIFIIILLLILIAAIIIPIVQSKIEKSKEVIVPNIVGKTLSQAREELSTLELNIKAQYPALYSDDPNAIIQTQEDEEGSVLKKGDTVEVTAKTQEQIDKDKKEAEERKKKEEEAKAKGYRSSPASDDTIISCAKTLINNTLRSSNTAVWGECEKVDEDNYGRCLVYVSLEAQNGFGAYSKLNYFVVLQYVETNGKFTYKPYIYSHELTTLSGQSVYDYYVTTYKNGEVYPVIEQFLESNDWNTRPSDV